MSRRRDRERYLANKRKDPSYAAFRGYELEQHKQPLRSVICSHCSRKRNIPIHVSEEGFICAACRGE